MSLTPPGPNGFPVLGNALRFNRNPLAFMSACRQAYGDVASFTLGTDSVYLLTNPADIKQVLTHDTAEYRKPSPQTELRDTLGDGLLLNEGNEIWSRQRQRVQPVFGMRQIAQSERLTTIIEYAEEMMATWATEETIDIRDETVRLTIKVIVDLMFGVELSDDTAVAIQRQLNSIGDSQSDSNIRQLVLPDWLTRTDPQFEAALDGLREILNNIVRQRRQAGPTGRMSQHNDSNNQLDFLSVMLDARSQGNIDETFLRDELMTILLAGHDTTSLAITYAIYLLAQHPKIEAHLHDEANTIGLNSGSEFAMDDIRGLEYTEQVLNEAMRLYPPVPIVPREPRVDVPLGEYRIPAGSILLMSQWVVHRDPRWYDDPERFDPSRWTREQTRERPRYAYFPFGAGPRVCIGKPIAELEAKLIIATIAQHYQVDLAMDDPLEVEANVTLLPTTPVEITVRSR